MDGCTITLTDMRSSAGHRKAKSSSRKVKRCSMSMKLSMRVMLEEGLPELDNQIDGYIEAW